MNGMPTLFVSHGAPTFALAPGRAGALLGALGRTLEKPRAIVIVSPHWMTPGIEVTSGTELATIHDFGGFPDALYRLRYHASGDPILAERIVYILKSAGIHAKLNDRRGLDHGAWVPLRFLYPAADVPVVQVSMPMELAVESAYQLGRALSTLTAEGTLVIGSGSLTHNLYEFRSGSAEEAGYAKEFTHWVRQAVVAGDVSRLQQALQLAPHARRAHPTFEHFLPLFVALGAAAETSPATVLDGGIYDGVLSMESYLFGRDLTASLR